MAEFISFQPTDYFLTHTYSGNSSTNNQTVGLTPAFTWVKSRNTASPTQHYLIDAVRGNEKYIISNSNAAEATDSETFELVANGFNLAGGNGWTNLSGRTYVSWNWKGGTTSVPSGGPITPSACSFDATSGFGAYAYTGTATNGTIAHGLGKVPGMILVKQLSGTEAWRVYHQNINAEDYLVLNTTAEWVTEAANWNSTAATSTVFSIGTDTSVNSSGGTFIAYVFANVPGFLRCGKYKGNGDADGTFIYTGFRPAYFMCKKASASGGSWAIYDNKREGYNAGNSYLEANAQDADDSADQIDIVSNGIKLRTTGGYQNTSGATYIYAAFAEFPIVSSNNIPTVAR